MAGGTELVALLALIGIVLVLLVLWFAAPWLARKVGTVIGSTLGE